MLDLGNLQFNSGTRSPRGPNGSEQLRQAVNWTRQASATLDQLRDEFPGTPLYHYEAANSHNSLANALVAVGEFDASKVEFDRANEILDGLALKFPEYEAEVSEFQSLRGVVFGSLAAFHFQIKKEPQAALVLVEKAMEHQQTAVRLAPSNPVFAQRLAEHQAYRASIQGALEAAGR